MTSKNLCFKLMKEDLKRRIWAVALLILSFFFCLVVPVAYAGSQELSYLTQAERIERITESILEMLGIENPFVVMLVVVTAIVCAVSGFSYLHSAKKVDLYHSLPIKRRQLFLANYFNGILMMAVVYLVAVLASMLLGAAYGVGIQTTGSVAITSYVFHMAYFCLLYTTTVIAMVMTGNVIIALLGTTVFFAYGPAVAFLFAGYFEVWFSTYVPTAANSVTQVCEEIMLHTSPFANYISNLDGVLRMYQMSDEARQLQQMHIPKLILTVLLVIGVLALIAWWLYEKRPSESAGKAMAFKKSMMPIKILLVVPIALTFCIFFWSLRSTLGWAIFGLVCGTVLSHCIIEIIYHFDFRKLFAHKRQLLFCLVSCVVIFCGFRYDLFGYDSYLPNADKVDYVSITTGNVDDWVTYGNIDTYTYSNSGNKEYYWSYGDSLDYVGSHMKIHDVETIRSLAKAGIEVNRQLKEEHDINFDRMNSFTIQYTLKNGKKAVRRYYIPMEMIENELQKLYDNEEYAMGAYPILLQTKENTKRVNVQQFNQITELENLSEAQISELLTAYQEELKSLTYETRKKEFPIATIQFVDEEMWKVLYENRSSMNENEYYNRVSNVGDRCYYPIYPSFTRTLTLLEQAGMKLSTGFTADMIMEIEIRDYRSSDRWEKESGNYAVTEYTVAETATQAMVYKEKADIEALVPALISQDYKHMNWLCDLQIEGPIDVTVIIGSGLNEKRISCYLLTDKLPDFLK